MSFRSPIGSFDPATEDLPIVGKECVICGDPIEVGDRTSLVADTHYSGVSHERCAWPDQPVAVSTEATIS